MAGGAYIFSSAAWFLAGGGIGYILRDIVLRFSSRPRVIVMNGEPGAEHADIPSKDHEGKEDR